jgi:GT2 family glycosyltransferase
MDPRFFMYWEDADWCRRMWQAGWEVVYWPLGTVVHRVGVSSRQVRLRAALEFHKSAYRLFDKYRRGPAGFNALVIAALAMRLPLSVALAVLRGILEPHDRADISPEALTKEKVEGSGAWNR